MLDLTLKRWLGALCCGALLVPGDADAAGLGRLTILSGLGQPLNAEIELISPQKGETLTARLAPIDLYQQANLTYNAALVGARVTVERRSDGRPYVKVMTPQRVSEPFAELLIELNSENGRVTRQYTVLLDPPGYGRAASEIAPPAAASPPAVRAQAPLQEARAPAPTAPAPTSVSPSDAIARAPAAETVRAPKPPAASVAPEASPASSPIQQYGPVKQGETLGRIARTVQPAGVTLEQTLVGLYRHNPDAFIKKNMNLVKSGRILKVPEASELAELPQREAVTEVRLQSANFESFRNRLADNAGSAAEAGNVTSGRIGARIAGREPVEARDTVRVSRAETVGAAGAKGGPDRTRALEEEMVAREKALADANERIAQLEKTIADMQRLAQMKGAASPPQAPAGASTGGPQTSGGIGTVPSSAVIAPAAAPASAPTPGAVPVLPPPATADAPAKPVDGAKSIDAAMPVDAAKSVSVPNPADGTPQGAPVTAAVPAKAPPAPLASPSPTTDLVDLVLGEPLYLAAGGAVLAGGLALVVMRRRRNGEDHAVKIGPTLGSSMRLDPTPDASEVMRKGEVITPIETGARDTPKAAPIVPPPPASLATSPRAAGAPGPEVGAAPFAAGSTAATSSIPTPPRPAPQPVSPSAAVPFATTDASDDNDLDFNAGTPSPVPAPAARTASASPTAATAPVFSAATAPAFSAATAPAPASPLAPASPEVPSPAVTSTESAEEAASRKLKTLQSVFQKSLAEAGTAESSPREISFADFSLDDSKSEPKADSSSAKEDAAQELTFEPLSTVDLPTEAKPAPTASDLDFKLADLDFDGAGHAPAGAPKDEHWYDVQQKFDLAKAYQEMGDKPGARDILTEVLKEGDSAQQAQAQKVLSSLS